MEQMKTHTSTPPTEPTTLKKESAVSSSESPKANINKSSTIPSGTSSSGGCVSANATGDPLVPNHEISDYVQDMRSLDKNKGFVIPSQLDTSVSQRIPDNLSNKLNRGNPAFNTTVVHNNTTIFKPFDLRTGQFLPLVTNNENQNPLRSICSKKSKLMKFRSYSVPTILHSSLRKLCLNQQTTSGGVYKKKNYLNVSNIARSKHINTTLLSDHTLNLHGKNSISDRINYIKASQNTIPLPPINLQCLKEIDLSEIVKNPQLRHDIVFDPLLQFRPNLDGERGIKKRQIADRYWHEIESELIIYMENPHNFQYNCSKLVPLFSTLKDVLMTIVPQKELLVVETVLDIELVIQELLKGSLSMSSLSDWLAQLFKHHCAPMRDPWVDKMNLKFKQAESEKSVKKLIDALRLVFQILEAMKLDIANHQIRILRPALLSNAVEFEKQYFQSLINSNRVDLKSSLRWFGDKYKESLDSKLIDRNLPTKIPEIYRLCIKSILGLLSCRKMVREYPVSLSFDHARLILLRADIRQVVCILVCRLLFKQLVTNDNTIDISTKEFILKSYPNSKLKDEVVSIITDEHGNCRWTKNTMSIAIHLCKTINDLKLEFQAGSQVSSKISFKSLDNEKIEFAKSWLSKQTQPLSEVYGVLENRVFQSLEENIFNKSNCTKDGSVKQDFINFGTSPVNQNTLVGASNTTTTNSSINIQSKIMHRSIVSVSNRLNSSNQDVHNLPLSSSFYKEKIANGRSDVTCNGHKDGTHSRNNNYINGSIASLDMEEFESLYRHLYTVINFHWSVFGCLYIEALGDRIENI